MFLKYLMKYQNVKIVKLIFKSEQTKKTNKSNVVLKESKKKDIKNRHSVCYMTFKYFFTTHTYLWTLSCVYTYLYIDCLYILVNKIIYKWSHSDIKN